MKRRQNRFCAHWQEIPADFQAKCDLVNEQKKLTCVSTYTGVYGSAVRMLHKYSNALENTCTCTAQKHVAHSGNSASRATKPVRIQQVFDRCKHKHI